MRSCSTRWVSLAATCVIAACMGCPRGTPTEPSADSAEQVEPSGPPSQADTAAAESTPESGPEPEPPLPAEVPEVHLTEALRQTCLVYVDDVMPQAELRDLAGNPQSLGSLYGNKLTVVFFWTSDDSQYSRMAATAALQDLQKDIAEPYSGKGVEVIGINVLNTPEVARDHVFQAQASFPNLVDPERVFFSQVATDKPPRVYLLDAEGKILWLDLEFSRTTRRNLIQAIQVELGQM